MAQQSSALLPSISCCPVHVDCAHTDCPALYESMHASFCSPLHAHRLGDTVCGLRTML